MTVELLPIAELLWKMLSELVRARGSRKKEFFQNHIEPLQDRMLRIHQDYVAGFEEVRRLIKDDSIPSEEVIEFLLERRRVSEAQRRLSRRLAEEIEKVKRFPIDRELFESVNNYCRSVVEYFGENEFVASPTWYTRFIEDVTDNVRIYSRFGKRPPVVWKSSSISKSTDPRGALLISIDDVLNRLLPRALDRVNTAYAALRAQLL